MQVCTSDLTARDHFCRHSVRRRIEHNKGKNQAKLSCWGRLSRTKLLLTCFSILLLKEWALESPSWKAPLCYVLLGWGHSMEMGVQGLEPQPDGEAAVEHCRASSGAFCHGGIVPHLRFSVLSSWSVCGFWVPMASTLEGWYLIFI